MPMLRLIDYSKRFLIHHLEREVAAFDSLNTQIEAGEFVLVTGANGVGKSTLLRCLYRTYKSSTGGAYYASRHGEIDLASAADLDVAKLRREELGFVTQFLRARPRVSALEWVAEPLLSDMPYEAALENAQTALATFGLKRELWRAYPSTFSGGEQQKVNLARALIVPRRLLLLDEPTASLDKDARRALVTRLRELKTAGVTMLGVFHHPEDVRELIDTTLTLSAPEAETSGADKEVLAHALG